MKKIIAAIIRFVMPNMIRQHEMEEKERRVHNANVLQHLLDAEHEMRDTINRDREQNWTTKDAIMMANAFGYNGDNEYNSSEALRNADFRQCIVEMNENVDGTGSPAIPLHSLYLYTNTNNLLDAAQKTQLCALNLLLSYISLLPT